MGRRAFLLFPYCSCRGENRFILAVRDLSPNSAAAKSAKLGIPATIHAMNQMSQTPRLRVDTHVHMHSCFEQDRFFAAAAVDPSLPGNGDRISGVLCLTETSERTGFGECRIRVSQESSSAELPGSDRHADRGPFGLPTSPTRSWRRMQAAGRWLSSRQIVTGEGLEVLALGLAGPFAAQPTQLEQAATAGAIPGAALGLWQVDRASRSTGQGNYCRAALCVFPG